MSPRLPALLAFSAAIFTASPASAQKPTYTLTTSEHNNTQTLREKRTGRVIWVKHFSEIDNITWSGDRRAVMFRTYVTPQERAQHPFGIKLVTWVAGGPVQTFSPHPELENDYIESAFWSPDDKNLLLKTGSSGDNDMGHGALICINIKTHRSLSVASKVRRVKWVQGRRVKYWDVYLVYGSDGKALSEEERPTPRMWRVPKGF